MAKYPKRSNERLFKDFDKYGRHFQTNERLLRRQHPEMFE